MGFIVLKAILAFLISAFLGYLFLLYQVSNCTGGFGCIGLVFAIPVYMASGGIILTIPIYFLLKKLPSYMQNHSRFIAIMLVIFFIALILFILPK